MLVYRKLVGLNFVGGASLSCMDRPSLNLAFTRLIRLRLGEILDVEFRYLSFPTHLPHG